MYNLSSKADNNILTINITGRITSDNAPDLDQEISGLIKDSQYSALVMNFDGLEMISSAGLRIMLSLKKKFNDFKIINASNDVYDVFDVTGFSKVMEVRKAFRNLSVNGCEIIGEGANGIVYRYNDDTIIKVFKNADNLDSINEKTELARKAFLMGIPTAISYDIVKVGDAYGAVFELVKSKSLSEMIAKNPDMIEKYAEDYAVLLKEIEKIHIEKDDLPNIKTLILKWASNTSSYLTEDENRKILGLVNNVPDDLCVIHGDFHSNNIVIQNNEMLLLDLDTLAYGNPIFEMASIFFAYKGITLIDPHGTDLFLGLDSDTCSRFFDLFLHKYFEDADSFDKFKDKILLVGYLRTLNHMVKRDTEKSKIDHCIALIREQLSKVDSIAI